MALVGEVVRSARDFKADDLDSLPRLSERPFSRTGIKDGSDLAMRGDQVMEKPADAPWRASGVWLRSRSSHPPLD